jgi:hypothetical protein
MCDKHTAMIHSVVLYMTIHHMKMTQGMRFLSICVPPVGVLTTASPSTTFCTWRYARFTERITSCSRSCWCLWWPVWWWLAAALP